MNEGFLVRDGKSILKIDIDDIDTDKLFSIFFEFPERTIYITDYARYNNDRVIGIITQGDFKRYLDGRKSVIYNDKFTTCGCDNESNVRCIFEQKRKVMSLPIVNGNGEIIKEYYRIPEKKKYKNNFSFVLDICKEACLSTYDVNIFVLDSFTEIQKREADGIKETTQGKIILTDHVNEVLNELKKKGTVYSKVLIYDMQTENMELSRLFYQSMNIPHFFLDADRIESLEKMNYISKYFTGAAYLDVNADLDRRLKQSGCFCKKYAVNDFVWDERLKCYCCTGEISEKIEVFFTYLKLSGDKFYIVMGDRYVPVISRFCDCVRVPNEGEQISDEDIAINIIPKLESCGVRCFVIEHPQKDYDALPEQEKFISSNLLEKWIFSPEIGGEAYDIFWRGNEAFLKERLEWEFIRKDGFWVPGNISGKYINYYAGERYTCGNPQKYTNTVFLFGGCNVWGSTVTDEQTLGSCMRDRIDKKYYIKNCGGVWEDINYNIRKNTYKSGDIVVIFSSRSEPYQLMGITLYSIWEAYRKMPDVKHNIWDMLYHGNYVETKYIADVLQGLINNNICLDKRIEAEKDLCISFGGNVQKYTDVPEGLKAWLSSTQKYRVSDGKRTGAIVMNCNPFTWGHRYLVEEARKQVDLLYIFVLEENKSFFDFNDRLNMVKIGVCDLENVIVIPSGKYIISSGTLPGYFEKEENPEVEFDATEDLEIFGQIIAKEFHIQIRFAGEEPSDQFTNRYNDFMRHLLPKYGVEFCEIPRKELDGEVISASKVRECIRDKKYGRLKELVMPDIYNYLNDSHFLE